MNKQAHIIYDTASLSGGEFIASILQKKYHFKLKDVRTMLRTSLQNKNSIGIKMKAYLDEGKLIPDELTTQMLEEQLINESSNIVFLHYPRTGNQTQLLLRCMAKHQFKLTHFWQLELENPEKHIASRLRNVKFEENSMRARIEKYKDDITFYLNEVHNKLEDLSIVTTLKFDYPIDRDRENMTNQIATLMEKNLNNKKET